MAKCNWINQVRYLDFPGNAVDGARQKAAISQARATELAAARQALIGTTLAPDYSYYDREARDANSYTSELTSYDYYLMEQEEAEAAAEVAELNNLVSWLHALNLRLWGLLLMFQQQAMFIT